MVSVLISLAALTQPQEGSQSLEQSLNRAPQQKAAWQELLINAVPEHKPGYEFILQYMPEADLKSLNPSLIKENVELAYKAFNGVVWKNQIPNEIFLNDILPYANTTESRDPWREFFYSRYYDRVKNIATPGEAALVLNAIIFKDFGVTYNTKRLRTDQSPKETIEQGMATCTGLSIMLVDACRAVGIPARVAGIASWPGRGGNHTWVEIYDQGDWHFVGAAEPDPKGLNHAWFGGEAAGAIADKPENAIFALSYKPTGQKFPLVWDPGNAAHAVNVTNRYKTTAPITGPRLMVEVKKDGQRVEAEVTAINTKSGRTVIQGKSFGPSVDMNRHIESAAKTGDEFLVRVEHNSTTSLHWATVQKNDLVITVNLDKPATLPLEKIKSLAAQRFSSDPSQQQLAQVLLSAIPPTAQTQNEIWSAYKSSPLHAPLRADFDAKKVTTSDRTSPYLWRKVGEEPKEGWSLVIAMHGGGGTTQEFNDQQWKGMFERYYKDHPESGGYIYLALRAPNNEWNGFYDDPIGPLVETLIKQFVLFENVNPNRVYATGASHGGYGAFVIGPKIPSKFAAVNASASAPTPGETEGRNLRNLPFTWVIGELDTAYERTVRCQAFAKEWDSLKSKYGGFTGGMNWLVGVGHSVPDRDKVKEFLEGPARNNFPDRVVWKQTDNRVQNFYWLQAPSPNEGGTFDATWTKGTVKVTAENQPEVILWLPESALDESGMISIEVAGQKPMLVAPKPNLGDYAIRIMETADPFLSTPIRIPVKLNQKD